MSEASADDSLERARIKVRIDPGSADAWWRFGRPLRIGGCSAEQAGMAYARSVTASIGEPRLTAAEHALKQGDLSAVETAVDTIAAIVGDYRESIGLYRGLVSERPDQAELWLGLGHGHRIVGERDRAVAAYREALIRNPRSGEAYSSLANLKSFDFTDDDIAAMTALSQDPTLPDSDGIPVEFALGQALLARSKTRSFDHFRLGNAARRRSSRYDAARAAARLQRWTELFTSRPTRTGTSPGHAAPDPIFIVGLPRSGSTLVEQILGSHPRIEATSELPYLDLAAMRARETGLAPTRDWAVPRRDYLTLARTNRQTQRTLFIDKMPNNIDEAGRER